MELFEQHRARAGLRLLITAAIAVLAAVTAPRAARAQVGSTTDIISGTVVDTSGAPLADVVIEAFSLETQITRRATTDARGRYAILFPDGGGQYRMTARIVGMAPRQAMVMRQSDEDRLTWNVSLAQNPITLAAVTVRAARPQTTADRPTPGSTERALSPEQMARLPVDQSDLAALAALSPGVIPIGASDTTIASFSVAGLGADANAVTLDGLLFGSATIPMDAVRTTRVITSTYDVARGQFSGGLVAQTTRGGTNVVQGSSNWQLRDQSLAVSEDSSPFWQGYTQNIISGGLGGPVRKDKLFVFASGQAQLRSDPQQTLLTASAGDFTRLGVAPESVAVFSGTLDSLTPSDLGLLRRLVPGSDTRATNNFSGLVRADYLLSATHTLTLRGDYRGNSSEPSRLGPLALPSTGGDVTSGGGGVMLSLSSRFGIGVINEIRTYWQGAHSNADPLLAVPQGRVQVISILDTANGDTTRGAAILGFGGNTGIRSRNTGSSLETTEELSWIPGDGAHRFKVGALYLRSHSDTRSFGNLGTFSYNSLDAMRSGQPSLFTRSLDTLDRISDSRQWNFYAGDVWVVTRPLQVTYGVRVENGSFANPPAYNPAVDSLFGRRTDALPSEWHLSPRVGFTWTIAGPGRPRPGEGFQMGQRFLPPALIIRGGVGEFRNPLPEGLAAQARSATGLANSASEIQCVGAAVPAPDWPSYVADPASVPAACADSSGGGGGGGGGGFVAPRSVFVMAPGFQSPRAWRGSLGFDKSVSQFARLTLVGSFARGVAQTGYTDLNLNDSARFRLADEANRPVYVPPQAIVPFSGQPVYQASRVDSAFGRVIDARSVLANQTEQVTLSLGGLVGKGIIVNASYTWQHSRDQQTGVRGGSTAADPNVSEWATSAFQRTHNFLATVTYPLSPALELTTIGRLLSGAPYTPMVASDVNGDGSANDRAFIFSPSGASAQAAAMQQLLAGAAGRVRSCLLPQVGQVAGRNSCTGPWTGTLDFQLNWRPAMWGLNRRLMVSVVTVNFLHGVDELLHGSAGEKGWGLTPRPDGNLLYVTGFDTAAQRYVYQVNQRFGATSGSATAFRPPFQVGIQVRLAIGPDRMRQALDAMRGGGRVVGGGGGGGLRMLGSPAQLAARFDSLMPNPAKIALDLRDSILLDSVQVARLTVIRDSLDVVNHARIDTMSRVLNREGSNADPARLFAELRPTFEALRTDRPRQQDLVHALLTPVQWARVEPQLRPPQGLFGPRPGGGGFERREP